MIFQESGFRVRLLVIASLFAALIFADASRAQTVPNISSWGTSQEPWGQELGLVAAREGCSDSPSSCAISMDAMAKSQNVSKIYLSILFNTSTSVGYAQQYSALSLTHKEIVEIGFDNFVAEIENLEAAGDLSDPGTLVSQIITATKSANPNLGFGVTIFEDQLTHAALQNAVLPAAVRAKVDYVHLYVRYRQDGANFASYLSEAKSIFPNAKIIAGAYSYDRIDYLPCKPGTTTACTVSQEESLYQQLLQTEANLLKQNAIFGLEFSFGYFGDPQDWPDWTQPQMCKTARLSACYSDTETMQTATKTVLNSTFGTAVSLSHTSLYMGSEYVNKLSTPGTVVLTNSGSGPLSVTSIGVTGTEASNFPLKHNCPSTVAPGGSCTLTIYFEPTAVGTREAEILISDNAGNGSQTVTLTGTGLASTGTSSTFLLSPSATQVAFGTVGVGTTNSKTVTISNTGTGSVTVSSVAVSGSGVTIKGLAAKTVLAARQSATVTITYLPTAAGSLAGTLVIVSNATNSPVVVSITGTAATGSGTAHSATLTWTKSTSTITGYRVYRGTTSGGPYTLLTATSLASTATSYTDTTVASGKTYYYVTTDVNSAGQESADSNQVTATIP